MFFGKSQYDAAMHIRNVVYLNKQKVILLVTSFTPSILIEAHMHREEAPAFSELFAHFVWIMPPVEG